RGTTQSSNYAPSAARADPLPAALHTLGLDPSRAARGLPGRPLSADAVDVDRLDHLRRRNHGHGRTRGEAAIALPPVDPRQHLARGRDVAPAATVTGPVRISRCYASAAVDWAPARTTG